VREVRPTVEQPPDPDAPRLNPVGGGPARTGSLRAHNLALTLRAVASAPTPLSRSGLAVRTGLTRASVSGLIDTLVAGRLVRETGVPTRSGVGRPSTGLVLDPAGPAGLGLELNVDHLAARVVDLTGAVRIERTVTVDRAAGRPLDQLVTLARETVTATDRLGLELSGVAVAVPGLVDPATGRLLVAPNLLDDSVRDPAGPRLAPADLHGALGSVAGLDGVHTAVENEATLAARAEQRALGAAAPRSFLQVSGEVGIGAGLVLDGRLYRGRHGWSGELGHVTVWPGGHPCGCGSDGCLEQYAGQHAILRAAANPNGGEPPTQTPASIADRATAGEPAMLAALTEAGRALGIALAGALNLLDLDAVVLGGLHATLAPWLVGPVEAELSRRLVGAPVAMPVVRASTLGADAAVLGAAWSVLDRVLDDPASWLAQRVAGI
jgi:predicted NBD/HSP70 family sugar kinase